jgi:hypothetical protein
MSREQELGLDKNRKKFDVREAYFVSPPAFMKNVPYDFCFVVEIECVGSGGLGTEAHRAAKGLARMGRRARAAIKPDTRFPIRATTTLTREDPSMLLVHQICSRVFAYYIMNEWIIFTATCHATPSTVSTLARLELPNGHVSSTYNNKLFFCG